MFNTFKCKRFESMIVTEYLIFIIILSIVKTPWLISAENNGREDRFDYSCEGQTLRISCNVGATISITDALYGYHWDDGEPRITCTIHLNLDIGEPCLATESTNIVSNMCNGQTECDVTASNKVFGDPCGGTSKYLRVNYTCLSNLASSLPPGYSSHPTLHQTTPSVDTTYTVADYDTTVLLEEKLSAFTPSLPQDSSSYVMHQTTPTSGTAHTVTDNFTPAGFEEKPSDDRFVYSCENKLLHISCNTDATIYITDALYGYDWDDGEPRIKCTKSDKLILKEGEQCLEGESKNKVSNMCHGQRECSVMASNAVFGDPCPGTFKYMRVNYTCVPRSCMFHQTTPSDHDTTAVIEEKSSDAFPGTLWLIAIVVVILLSATAMIYVFIKTKMTKEQKRKNRTTDHETTNIDSTGEHGMHMAFMNFDTSNRNTAEPVENNDVYQEVYDVVTYEQTINEDSHLSGEIVYNVSYEGD